MKFLFRKMYYVLTNLNERGRTFYYARLFEEFGRKSRIIGRISVSTPQKVKLGQNSTLNEGVILNAYHGITIGNNVRISAGAQIITANLTLNPDEKGVRFHTGEPVVIGNSVWIGSGAIINPGVTIGENSIIGAGAVVTSEVKPNSIYVGVPARFLREINPSDSK
ncbi:MAG: WblB protein [uncultured bacterium]|nr:MAG: WblB protein [uncultured bacterium]